MMYAIRSSIVLALTLLWASSGWAKELLPFADLNDISKIERTETKVTFHTSAGSKSLHLDSNEWTYTLNADISYPNSRRTLNVYDRKSIRYETPSWYTKSTYVEVIAVDDVAAPRWLLTANAGESATYSSQDLIDIAKRRVYRLPYEQFSTFAIDDRDAWVAGEQGLTRINLDSRARFNYMTLPAFDTILAHANIANRLYYLTRSRGLFFIERETGEIHPVKDVNVYTHRGYRFLAAVQTNDGLWMLARQMDSPGRYVNARSALLLINFETGAEKVSVVETGITFADHLIPLKDVLIGYGNNVETFEGGDTVTSGGAFRYDLQSKTLTVLTRLPVETLQLDPPRVVSIVWSEGPLFVRTLESPELSTPFKIIHSEWLTDQEKDSEGYGLDGKTLVPYKGDRARYRALLAHRNDAKQSSEKIRKSENMAAFGELRVRIRTVVTPAGETPFHQF